VWLLYIFQDPLAGRIKYSLEWSHFWSKLSVQHMQYYHIP
jgi:hypothetical protein